MGNLLGEKVEGKIAVSSWWIL